MFLDFFLKVVKFVIIGVPLPAVRRRPPRQPLWEVSASEEEEEEAGPSGQLHAPSPPEESEAGAEGGPSPQPTSPPQVADNGDEEEEEEEEELITTPHKESKYVLWLFSLTHCSHTHTCQFSLHHRHTFLELTISMLKLY